MRKVLKITLVLFATYSLLLVAFFAAMCQKPGVFGSIMSRAPAVVFMAFPFKTMWLTARQGSLKAGDEAPDFTLETYDKASRVQLSEFRGKKPVVLVFGSYT
jgi:hypothetical protein